MVHLLTPIVTLSLHDALPIYAGLADHRDQMWPPVFHSPRHQRGDQRQLARAAHERPPGTAAAVGGGGCDAGHRVREEDRKSTRLNSSHSQISYAVFCLKKKK